MNTQDNELDRILETYGAEAFIFGNFALGKDAGIPQPDNDHELPPIEKAKLALTQLIDTKVREVREENEDMKRFIAALVFQSGGVVTITNRTLRDVPIKVDFEILTNIDKSITIAIPQDEYVQLSNPEEK